MHFSYPQKVLFKHCDPAGIVFFPRYAEMVNDAVEAMFGELLGWPYEVLHPDASVPTITIDMHFKAPSRHGDMLELQVTIKAIGRTSLTLQTVAVSGGETRFTADHTLVCIDEAGRPQRWPAHLRDAVDRILEDPT